MTKTLARFDNVDENCLIIPEGLTDFDDAKAVMKFGKNAIFHKLIRTQQLDVEFYNSMPCICFVMSGSVAEANVLAAQHKMIARLFFQ